MEVVVVVAEDEVVVLLVVVLLVREDEEVVALLVVDDVEVLEEIVEVRSVVLLELSAEVEVDDEDVEVAVCDRLLVDVLPPTEEVEVPVWVDLPSCVLVVGCAVRVNIPVANAPPSRTTAITAISAMVPSRPARSADFLRGIFVPFVR